MPYTDIDDIDSLYSEAKKEGQEWKRDYDEYERLMDNGLLETIDPDLPLINDGSLAASLFKLPKRIVNSKLTGHAKAVDRDEAWLSELANMQWENNIIPNANTQAPFHRKWKDAVRKAAGYGSIPLVTIFTERGNYTGADFIVVQPQDMTLEPGKVSDYDSDIFFWDVYFTDSQLDSMIEQAEKEQKEAKDGDEEDESYNKWDIPELKRIRKGEHKEDRDSMDTHESIDDKSVTRGGYHFCVVFNRGVEAPFYMYHKSSKQKKPVREWTNPDPTGDVPVHYLYCYQDFINPYGIGIVKLAGGTQNVLDYMRQADVLATQLGLKPPLKISGDVDDVDEESLIYAQDAHWWVGNADVERMELATSVYGQLPNRMAMYKTSLNQLIPTGDTSIGAAAGDPQYSKTPAGVEFQAANLSIDDDDFRDNLYMTYEAVAKSMINTHFANMQGIDLMKLNDDEREILAKSGLKFPVDEQGEPTNEVEIEWDLARAEFNYEVDAEEDSETDKQQRLEALLKVAEFRTLDPTIEQAIMMSGKRLNLGELFSSIIMLTTDNDKILEDITPEEQEQQALEQQALLQQQQQQQAPQPQAVPSNQAPPVDPQALQNMQDVMQTYNVDEQTAAAMLSAEAQGYPPEQILAAFIGQSQGVAA